MFKAENRSKEEITKIGRKMAEKSVCREYEEYCKKVNRCIPWLQRIGR